MGGIIGVVDEEVIVAEGDASVLDLIQEFDNSLAAFVIREAVEVDGFGEHLDPEDIIEGGSADGGVIVHVFCHLISSISGVVNQAVGMGLQRRQHEIPADQAERAGVGELYACPLAERSEKTKGGRTGHCAQQWLPRFFSLILDGLEALGQRWQRRERRRLTGALACQSSGLTGGADDGIQSLGCRAQSETGLTPSVDVP